MRKCKHDPDTFRRIVLADPVNVWMTCDVCGRCGAWLSLGPANDTLRVVVEIRAAEIAADDDEMGRMMTGPIDHEVLGYILACQAERGFAFDKSCRNGSQLAGYLARCIATHDTEQSR